MGGKTFKNVGALCPVTMKMLKHLPDVMLSGFSFFEPGAILRPHVGPDRSALICHLAIKIPGQCGIVVAGVKKEWVEGKCLIFDDTLLHSAWNQSKDLRAILFVSFRRPGFKKIPKDVLEKWDIFGKQLAVNAIQFCKNEAPKYSKFAQECFSPHTK